MGACIKCGAPAAGNDPTQGGPVCIAHAATLDERDPEMRHRVRETIESAREHLATAERSLQSAKELLRAAGHERPRDPSRDEPA